MTVERPMFPPRENPFRPGRRHRCHRLPADQAPGALVDLLLYLEKHFTTLPREVNGRSLAFDLLRTVRLSLRKIAQYGKYEKDDDE
jgi:hypothetical protein